jgi:hypothetical protein
LPNCSTPQVEYVGVCAEQTPLTAPLMTMNSRQLNTMYLFMRFIFALLTVFSLLLPIVLLFLLCILLLLIEITAHRCGRVA